jgi:hypothetical protein
MTINKIVSELKYIQVQHRQLNDFFFGDFVDAINKETPPQYAYLIATLQNSTDSNNTVGVNMILTVCDQYELGNTRMIQEIHSDCYQILNDIKTTMLQERWVDFMDININVSKEPFINKGHDVTAGWSMSVQMNVFDEQNWCNIPYIDYDFENGYAPPSTDCLPVTIIDGLEVIEVPSGGEYTCSTEPTEITVSNSNNTYSVTTDENLELPNTTVNVYVDGILNQTGSIVTLDPNQTINITA